MTTHNYFVIDKCSGCGKSYVEGSVACSAFGAISLPFCKDCLKSGRDNYHQMVIFIANAGRFPEDINDIYQQEVHMQLKLHQKTEDEFIRDVDLEIHDELEFIRNLKDSLKESNISDADL